MSKLDKFYSGELECDYFIAQRSAQAVNRWLHVKGQSALDYGMFLDRVFDIKEVIEPTIKQGQEDFVKYKNAYSSGELEALRIKDKARRKEMDLKCPVRKKVSVEIIEENNEN